MIVSGETERAPHRYFDECFHQHEAGAASQKCVRSLRVGPPLTMYAPGHGVQVRRLQRGGGSGHGLGGAAGRGRVRAGRAVRRGQHRRQLAGAAQHMPRGVRQAQNSVAASAETVTALLARCLNSTAPEGLGYCRRPCNIHVHLQGPDTGRQPCAQKVSSLGCPKVGGTAGAAHARLHRQRPALPAAACRVHAALRRAAREPGQRACRAAPAQVCARALVHALS